MRQIPLTLALLGSVSLAGCATSNWTPPEISYDAAATPQPAALAAEAPRPVEVVQVPTPLPLPGQLQRVPAEPTQAPEPTDPRARVEAANSAARVQPFRSGYFNAVQVYPYSEGALYQLYAAPGQVTDIALQPGEQLVGTGPVAAGDTVRWIIGDTISGSGPTARVHILVKPIRPDLQTNLVINTDRRTYHLEMRSAERTYMASVSWSYPQDALIALRRQNAAAEAAQPIASSDLPSIENLNFRYTIEGDRPAWRPVRAFDDGRQVFIEFPAGIGQGEMPPLWIIGAEGDAQLVNYRIRGRFIVVDRLFGGAELRLGGERQRRVRIVRTDARPAS